MYRFWEPIVRPLLDLTRPQVVVEIGSDEGLNTRNLLEYCHRTDAALHVIDPDPKYDPEEWVAAYPQHLIFHQEPSLDVLGSIDDVDLALIDGDHNWHTVLNELRLLREASAGDADRFPVVLFHDVGWPYGRRDLYYEPDRIPPPDLQPHSKAGIRPGRRDLDPDGGLNAHLFNANTEGGLRNGVLTAIEDFMAETGFDLELVVVPGVNDLGILFSSSLRPAKPGVVAFIDGLNGADNLRLMLARVEELRVEAQIEAADRTRERNKANAALREGEKTLMERDAQLAAQESRLSSASQERDELKAQAADLQRELAALRRELDNQASLAQEYRADAVVERDKATDAQKALIASKADSKDLRKQTGTLKKRAALAEQRYKRLRSRRSVRLVLALTRPMAPLVRMARRARSGRPAAEPAESKPSPGGRSPTRPLGKRAQSRLAKAIVGRRAGSERASGPLVSIVVLTRNGADHMRRLLAKLDDTVYRSFEVIVVDNASTDDTAQILEAKGTYPLKVIRNESNRSFSEGNNQGVDIAEGTLLLFLNNDIEPINPGWLGAMVAAIEADHDTVAVGAELVYPVRGERVTDLTVQHGGTHFGYRDAAVHPYNTQYSDPLDPRLEGAVSVPAATAAALLVEADAFHRVGRFDEGYVYGTEDVDLCLKLGEIGKIVVTGQAVLFHHESATQTSVATEITQINRRGNRQRFAETWSPRLTRSVLRDRLTGTGFLSGRSQRTVAITLTHDDISRGWGDYYTAHELGDVFDASGWHVVYAERYQDRWYDLDEDVDLLVSLLDSYDVRQAPDGAFTFAWVRNWVDRWLEQPWFDDYDLVATSSHRAASLIAEGSRFMPSVVPLATNPDRFKPGPSNPTFESDYVFTGNNWGPGRNIVRLLDVHPGERFIMFGKGWEKDPRAGRYWRGAVDYELLPEVYRSTKIVLDDTASPTLPYGFLNGRVFDALASGSLVLTDNVIGSEEMFGGLLPTYSGRADLRVQLDHFLDNESERLDLVNRLRESVSTNHTYASRPADLLSHALEHLERPRAAIKIAVPNEEVKASWGDTHFADGLASALTRLGMPTEIHILPEWDLPSKQSVDVVIHLRGLSSYAPKPAHLNVLWIISHPDDVTSRECEKYDLVLVASQPHAEWLESQVDVPVVYMPQATDARRFRRVESRPELTSEVLFVGNSRGESRPAVEWAIDAGLPLTIYGGGWDGRIPPRYVRADHYPNDELAYLYASAKVVLNDHWPDMRDRGFISNRVFDALASGAVLVSDRASGLDEMFGDLVPTYSTQEELESVVRELLTNEVERKELSDAASIGVSREHTFDQRAVQLTDLIRPLLIDRRKDLEGHPYSW